MLSTSHTLALFTASDQHHQAAKSSNHPEIHMNTRMSATMYRVIIAAAMSGLVKLGWEVILPARTPDRASPPVVLLEQAGLPANEWTYTFSAHTINFGGITTHFIFCAVAAAAFLFLAQRIHLNRIWLVTLFGTGAWLGFHWIALPLLGLTRQLRTSRSTRTFQSS
ncbi:DUF1440 domain-containing protein [Pseudonocardia sp. ICBG601]|uniref:DUF1440 domain-containing protein n=1 Tax=Pseudonocardia sp. ICBG601 TaxID=2846759 RepID=UPI001CF6EDF0|nr:DUF1440 domain-containing protein [Pseudonocardia sp. ICBG601]